ncbi:leucine efflux protein LeuE [Azohydromonas aeria]|uniref:leucine efflux protein LeuE n=1 Tax=Azohydromonas aeria TaxID=2590212 RepID=UPI0012F947C0|nr:leucine efflux protein LeuE [Azohydromonas aeria]
MVYGITDLYGFVLGTILIILLPGPNSFYVMTLASRQGAAAGWRGATGIFAGDTVLMTLSACGVASLLSTYPALFFALKYAGAAYLSWLGFKLLRSAWQGWRGTAPAAAVETAAAPVVRDAHPFRTALTISLLNPKAILFCVSFFIQFVSPDYEYPALSFFILGAIVQIFSAAYLTLLIFAGSKLAERVRRYQRLSAVGTGGVGAAFIGFGVKLAGGTLR